MNLPIFNQDKLQTWKEVDPDQWQSIVLELICAFLDSSKGQYDSLLVAWKGRDLDKVRQIAHSLKSSCGNVGAENAQSLFAQIEMDIMQGKGSSAESSIHTVQKVFPETMRAIAAYRNSNSQAA